MYVALGMLARVVSHCIRHLPVRSLNIKKFSECVAGFIAARAKLKQETLPPCVGSHFALPSKALFVCFIWKFFCWYFSMLGRILLSNLHCRWLTGLSCIQCFHIL